MILKLKLVTVIVIGLFMASCAKEGIEKNTESQVGTQATIDAYNASLDATNSEEQERAGRWCCWGWLDASPCGYGYVINISNLYPGATVQSTYYYEIIESGTTNTTTGWVANGGNTTWNLSPCTEYDIYVYHPEFGYPLVNLNVMSDGCGNVFIC